MLDSLQVDLIFPGHRSQGLPSARVSNPTSPGAERVELRSKAGERIVALFGTAARSNGILHPNPRSRPSLLFFYGNGMHLSELEDILEFFRRLEANVLIPEYLGYGESEGQASEQGCFATADAAYQYLRTRPEIDPNFLVAAGWSLGGAVAINLASRADIAGLAVFSTFTNAAAIARLHFPMIPTFLLQHRFESLETLPQVKCPIFIGHGKADDLVPFAQADKLAQAARAPVTRLSLDDVGHNDFFSDADVQLAPSLRSWLDGLSSPN